MTEDSSFLELCRRRRSVRRFLDRPVEHEKLELCLEAARLAPSADNFQPWRFVVFDDPAEKAILAKAAFGGIYAFSRRFASAPVLVLLLIKESLAVNRLGGGIQGTPLQILDAGIAGEHFVLAAAEQGLGTCWIGWYNSRAVSRHLKLSRKYRPLALFAVGYPAPGQGPRTPKRKPLDRIVFWNQPPK